MRIGLDFGTTNSGVGLFDGERVTVLPLDPNGRDAGVVRTLLYLTREGQVQVGQAAIDLYYEQNIGRARQLIREVVGEIQVVAAEIPPHMRSVHVMVDALTPGRLFQSLKSGLKEAGFTGTDVFGRVYTLEELIALYLETLRRRASQAVGQAVTAVVLGRPVNFGADPSTNEMAEGRLRAAAELAGFEEITFELEPVAAALAYARAVERPHNILVFDFGGGTLDLTVMRVGGGERQLLATGGIDVAGDTFDRAIIRFRLLDHFGRGTTLGERRLPFPAHLTEALTHWQEIPTLSNPKTLALLQEAQQMGSHPARIKGLEALVVKSYGFAMFDAVERGKRELSQSYTTVIRLQAQDIEVWQLLTRLQFEMIIAEYQREIASHVEDTVARSGLAPGQIDAVVRTGGSSEIPAFIRLLEEQFGAQKLRLENTFSGVTAGLAIRAWELDHRV
jgi:hypothetical chaperone protein